MNGLDFERYVANYLRNSGYSNVTVTKASGDYGVDITAKKGKDYYAIQCKYYSSPVGVHAVQEVASGMMYYGCNRAIVVTNNTFTPQAQKMAKELGVILLDNF